MRTHDDDPGGQGDAPSRSELALERQALRQDWPIPPDVKRRILQRVVDYLDADSPAGEKAAARTVLSAAQTVALFGSLALKQQALDLQREKLEGNESEVSLADLVEAAESRAEARLRERGEG